MVPMRKDILLAVVRDHITGVDHAARTGNASSQHGQAAQTGSAGKAARLATQAGNAEKAEQSARGDRRGAIGAG